MAIELKIKSKETENEFFSYLFSLRDSAHLSHLAQKDKSLATHLALGDYYEGMTEHIDAIVEGWTGVNFPPSLKIIAEAWEFPEKAVQEAYTRITKAREMFKETWLQNMIDEVLSLHAKTLFKLKYVK